MKVEAVWSSEMLVIYTRLHDMTYHLTAAFIIAVVRTQNITRGLLCVICEVLQ